MAGAWGAPTSGAWAAQVDEEEEANGGVLSAPPAPVPVPFGHDRAFPTLGEAVKKKESKKDKKKPQKMNLADFQSNYKPPSQTRRPGASDDQIKLSLPTAPRARDDDAPSGGLGGAFRDYGGGRDRGDSDRGRDKDRYFGRRDRDGSQDGSEGGFSRDEPSRADADDDWGATRKFVASGGSSGGGFGSGGFGSRRDDRDRDRDEEAGPSRADTVDDWGASRKFTPSDSARSTGSGGFEDRPSRGFGSRRDDEAEGPSRADAESRWGSSKFVPSSSGGGGSGGGGFEDRSRGLDKDNWSRRGVESGSGSPAPSNRPRLKLAPRTKPLPVLDIPPEAQLQEKKEPETEPEADPAPVPTGPPKPKPNPFGAARPREDVLKEKGRDWIKEDIALERKKEVADSGWARRAEAADIQEGLNKLPAEVASASNAADVDQVEPKTPDHGEEKASVAAEAESTKELSETAEEDKTALSGVEAAAE